MGSPYQCPRSRKKPAEKTEKENAIPGTAVNFTSVTPAALGGPAAKSGEMSKPPKKRNRSGQGVVPKVPGTQTIILPSTEQLKYDAMPMPPPNQSIIAPVYNLATMSPVEGGLINTFELVPPPLPAKDEPAEAAADDEVHPLAASAKRRRGRPIVSKGAASAAALAKAGAEDLHGMHPQQLPHHPPLHQFFPMGQLPNVRPLQYHQYCPEDLSATGGRPTANCGVTETQPSLAQMEATAQLLNDYQQAMLESMAPVLQTATPAAPPGPSTPPPREAAAPPKARAEPEQFAHP